MNIFLRRTLPFTLIIILAFLVFLFSIWDIIYDEKWLERIIALYGILVILTLLFLVSTEKKKPNNLTQADDYEKFLEGKLRYFKCPSCDNIFTTKKINYNNKKSVTLTCPTCGIKGNISLKTYQMPKDIPEKNQFIRV